MRALVLEGPGQAGVQEVPVPVAGPGLVVVKVHRAGVCGTDAEFFSGHMAYLTSGQARYPLRPGHEWAGTITSVGQAVDESWLGRRVTGDTMLGCHHCERCRAGRQHICANRFEVGVLGGWHGAVAEQLLVPVTSLHPLPDSVGDEAGAMVEPGANSCRAVQAAQLRDGSRVAVFGPGTIGLLAAAFAMTAGAEVHVIGRSAEGLALARDLGVAGTWTLDELTDQPGLTFDAVIDGTDGPQIPAAAVDLVEPGGTVVFVGLSATPSLIDTRTVVLKDITLVGHLSGSPAMAATVAAYAAGAVDPTVLVGATVGLAEAADVLAGHRPTGAGPGPKILIDPHRR